MSIVTPEARRRYSRKYYANNREKEIARCTAYHRADRARTNRNAVIRRSEKKSVQYVLFWNARNRSKAQGIEFNLEMSDIVVPTHCPILGIELKVGTGCAKPYSPSLDRIDPTRGYVKGNVAVISHKANTIKSNATLAELELVCAFMGSVKK